MNVTDVISDWNLPGAYYLQNVKFIQKENVRYHNRIKCRIAISKAKLSADSTFDDE
jgi:hypothetical protein